MHSNKSADYLLLHYVLLRRSSRGFTLIELLVVIVVLGILSAIALPSIINHALKAKESEARLYVSAVNRDQQRYYMENGRFSPDIANLALGISANTSHYVYQTQQSTDPGSGVAIALTEATQINPQLRAFSGQVWIGVSGNDALTTSIFCESDVGEAPPSIVNHQCP